MTLAPDLTAKSEHVCALNRPTKESSNKVNVYICVTCTMVKVHVATGTDFGHGFHGVVNKRRIGTTVL